MIDQDYGVPLSMAFQSFGMSSKDGPSLEDILGASKLGQLFNLNGNSSTESQNTHYYYSTQEFLHSVIFNAYQWGSRVYGNYNEKSDWDYIFVIKDEFEERVLQLKKPVEGL